MGKNPAKDYGIELKPCPFCGAEATALSVYHRNAVSKVVPWFAYVQCTRCLAEMPAGNMTMTEEQAVRLAAQGWNRRAKESA